jgi:hypothetical protein
MAIAAAAQPAAATAAWTHSGSGAPFAKAVSMPTGATPTASVSNRSVTVSWSASTMPGGGAVSGYLVQRYDTNGNVQAIGSACAGTIAALTCTETSVPGGTWRYTVTPVKDNWVGAESSQSSNVSVASPSLTFSSSTTVTSLPTTLNGSIAAFVGGQTVTYRLDDPSTGTVLSGTTSPSTIPSGGGASVTVTIPAGTSNGSHTVYAVGSSGDVSSASITIAVSYSFTTSGWDLRDASSGVESNKSASYAFQDAILLPTGLWPSAFSTTRYFDFDPNAPLPAGFSVSGANFNFRYAAAAAGETACYWFEVRSISTGLPITGGTHGGSSSPVDCTTGTTQKSVSTPIPELDTTNEANDLRIRVYGRESASKAMNIDLATISGTANSTAFTLYTNSYTDAAAGAPGTTTQWALAASGGATYTSAAIWSTSFSSTRYLKLTFPSYVPSTATVSGATFKMNYRPVTSGSTHNACYWFDVTAGTSPVVAHGSTAAPVSCESTSTYQADSWSLPEIDTPAEANSVVVKVYFRVSTSATQTNHDLGTLTINYQ